MRCAVNVSFAALMSATASFVCGGVPQNCTSIREAFTPANDCQVFTNLSYLYEHHHNRTVFLVLDLTRELCGVKVQLRSADCIPNCSLAYFEDACNATYQDTAEPAFVDRNRKKYVAQRYAFHNVSGDNFCAKMSLDHCGSFFPVALTSTSHFVSRSATMMPPVGAPVPRPPEFPLVIAVSTTLAVALLVGIAVYCARAKIRCLDNSSESSLGLLTAPVPLLGEPPPLPSAVLLLYSRDSMRFLRLMATFRSLLAALTGLQVLDPLDDRRYGELAPDPVGWLTRQMRRPDIRLVLVESSGAVARQEALLSGQAPPRGLAQRHFLDGLFTHALRLMHDDHRIGANYNRVYTARIEDIIEPTKSLSLIVPMRTFCLMRHIARLVHEIQGKTHPMEGDDEALSRALLEGVPEAKGWQAVLSETYPNARYM